MKLPLKYTIVPLSDVPTKEQQPTKQMPPKAPSVLIVDDERLVADTLRLIFMRAGFNTSTAYSAAEALEIARITPPDMLVSDVDMPDMSGVDLALSLLDLHPTTQILLFSGHASADDLARARALGHDFPLLPKPVPPHIMLESVSNRLGIPTPVPTNRSSRLSPPLRAAFYMA